jgi:hypothetical protein
MLIFATTNKFQIIMGNKNLENPPTGGIILTMILLAIFAIVVIVGLIKGFAAFIEDGGWIWLLVVGGLALFVFLLSRANRNH